MIICSCRNISHKNFKDAKELIARLKQSDVKCATCLQSNAIKKYKELYKNE